MVAPRAPRLPARRAAPALRLLPRAPLPRARWPAGRRRGGRGAGSPGARRHGVEAGRVHGLRPGGPRRPGTGVGAGGGKHTTRPVFLRPLRAHLEGVLTAAAGQPGPLLRGFGVNAVVGGGQARAPTPRGHLRTRTLDEPAAPDAPGAGAWTGTPLEVLFGTCSALVQLPWGREGPPPPKRSGRSGGGGGAGRGPRGDGRAGHLQVGLEDAPAPAGGRSEPAEARGSGRTQLQASGPSAGRKSQVRYAWWRREFVRHLFSVN